MVGRKEARTAKCWTSLKIGLKSAATIGGVGGVELSIYKTSMNLQDSQGTFESLLPQDFSLIFKGKGGGGGFVGFFFFKEES